MAKGPCWQCRFVVASTDRFFLFFFLSPACNTPGGTHFSLPANIRRGRRMSDPSRRRSLCIYSARLPARLQREGRERGISGRYDG